MKKLTFGIVNNYDSAKNPSHAYVDSLSRGGGEGS